MKGTLITCLTASLGLAQVSAAFNITLGPVPTGSPAHLLQSRRDCDDLLDGAPQPLDVVVPVQDLSVQEASTNRVRVRDKQQQRASLCNALC